MPEFDRIVTFVDSGALDEVAYSLRRQELQVKFPNTKTIWRYYDVPPDVLAELLFTESAGRYFNENIRNNYSAKRMGKYEYA